MISRMHSDNVFSIRGKLNFYGIQEKKIQAGGWSLSFEIHMRGKEFSGYGNPDRKVRGEGSQKTSLSACVCVLLLRYLIPLFPN